MKTLMTIFAFAFLTVTLSAQTTKETEITATMKALREVLDEDKYPIESLEMKEMSGRKYAIGIVNRKGARSPLAQEIRIENNTVTLIGPSILCVANGCPECVIAGWEKGPDSLYCKCNAKVTIGACDMESIVRITE